MRILDIGSGPESMAAVIFKDVPDKEIVRLDALPEVNPDILHDITQPLPAHLHGQFDIVYCSHVLEHIDRVKVIPTIRNLTQALANLGELWVLVPSLDWAASEIVQGRSAGAILALLYGSQDTPFQYHRVGFTLRDLRVLMEAMGLVMRKAYQSPFTVVIDETRYTCIQNVCIAARYDGFAPNVPAEAVAAVQAAQSQQKRDNPGAPARRSKKKRKRK